MADDGLKVSIIIPVFNQLDLSRRCIDSLFRSLGESSTLAAAAEIIVVDNGSFDGSRQWAEAYQPPAGSGVAYRFFAFESNQGFAKGANAGARLAAGRFLLFLNNDTEVFPGTIDALVEPLELNPGAGVVGGRLLYPDNTVQHAGMACHPNSYWDHVFRGFPAEHPAVMEMKSFQAVTGACLLISRQLFMDVDQFDEGYLNSYEDIDLCMKVRSAGKSVLYAPKAVLYHYEGMSQGRSVGEDRNFTRFMNRWRDKIKADFDDHTEKHLGRALARAEMDLAEFHNHEEPYRSGRYVFGGTGDREGDGFAARHRKLYSDVIMLREGMLRIEVDRLRRQLAADESAFTFRARAGVRRGLKWVLRLVGARGS